MGVRIVLRDRDASIYPIPRPGSGPLPLRDLRAVRYAAVAPRVGWAGGG